MSTLLVLGGARSGKSRYAISVQPRDDVVFVATAEARDADMATRIARHRAERPLGWTTIEEPYDLTGRLEGLPDATSVVVDCLTLWVANRQLRGDDDRAILRRPASRRAAPRAARPRHARLERSRRRRASADGGRPAVP